MARHVQSLAESLINLMPAYQMNPDQMGPIVRNNVAFKRIPRYR
ncbi:hypothetical protein [Rhizobium leguminosarum]